MNPSTKLPPRMMHKFKLRNKEMHEQTLNLNNDIELMTDNLLKVQRQLTEEIENQQDEVNQNDYKKYQNEEYKEKQEHKNKYQSQISANQSRYYMERGNIYQQPQKLSDQQQYASNQPQDQLQTILKQKYEQYLSTNTFSSNYQHKINQLLDQEQNSMSLGNCIALFQMIFYFRQILTPQILRQIQDKAFIVFVDKFVQVKEQQQQDQQIKRQQSIDQKLLKNSLCQLIAICGIQRKQIIQFFVQYMVQNPQDYRMAYKVLSNMGHSGLRALINIVGQNFQQISHLILQQLSRNQSIIQKILIPQLINDITMSASSSKQKNVGLLILSKLGKIAHSQNILQILISLFKNSNVDKKLLILALKSVGKQKGQQILIDLLRKKSLNQDIGVFIVSILANNQQKQPQINIQLVQYQMLNTLQINKLYMYEGQTNSIQNLQKHPQTLYINSIMLMTSLQKIFNNNDYTYLQEEETYYNDDKQNQNSFSCSNNFILPKIITQNQQEFLPNLLIVNTFLHILDKSQSVKLKQAVIENFGKLTLPEDDQEIVDKISSFLWSQNASLKCAACTTLSQINLNPSQKTVKKLIQLLRDNFWKVRISACQTIGNLIHQPYEQVISVMIKCLKDGSINRQLICFTLIKMHPSCQKVLISLLNQSQDHKIQQIILCSFASSSQLVLQSPNFKEFIETVLKFSVHTRKQIRFISIKVIDSLRKYAVQNKIQGSSTYYFKAKNILPFYYKFLDDSCHEIRNVALDCIFEFGSYAELFLVQGMTKGSVNCKVSCAKGLGRLGVQNFRALLLGMRDPYQKVRRQCGESILQNFSIQQIIQTYKQKLNQSISLIYNIKDLLEGNFIDSDVKQYLQCLSYQLSQSMQSTQPSIDQQKQIESEIAQFRNSMKMRKLQHQIQQDSLQRINNQPQKSNIYIQQEDAENVDPNIINALKQLKNFKGENKINTEENRNKIIKKNGTNKNIENQKTQNKNVNSQSNAKTNKIGNKEKPKVYYFKLNQPLQA